jgi:hypothetical protein
VPFRTGGTSHEQRRHCASDAIGSGPAAHHGADWCRQRHPGQQQVDTLDEILSEAGHRVDAVICLQADGDELVERLLRRGREQGRTDDTERTIRNRLAVYSSQTAPLTDTHRKRGLLAEVDGLGDVGAVSARIFHALTSSGS